MELLANKSFLLLPTLPVEHRIMLSGHWAASDRRVRVKRSNRFGISPLSRAGTGG